MKIWISSLREVHNVAASVRPASVVSLLAPNDIFPKIEALAEDEHHHVKIHDILDERDGHTAPNGDHVRELVAFLRGWRPDEPLLVHCWAGMSRSTATAFIAACLHNPHADETVIADTLKHASPTAFPNTRIVSIADDLLGRNGRMTAAAEDIRSDVARLEVIAKVQEATPFSIPARYEGSRVHANS